jgi:hypothetical protein
MSALPPKVVELQDVILPLVGPTNTGPMPQRQTAQFFALHGLNSVNDFNLIEPHQAKDMFKAVSARHPAQVMGILIQNNLTRLTWYVKDRTRRGLPGDANNIVLDDLHHGHMACQAYIQNRDKGENIKALKKWCDKYNFDDWDRKVTETLSLMYGCNYCPIAYVIWPDKQAGWNPAVNAVNEYERLMYQLPLNGIAFERNETVFSFIQLAVVHS